MKDIVARALTLIAADGTELHRQTLRPGTIVCRTDSDGIHVDCQKKVTLVLRSRAGKSAVRLGVITTPDQDEPVITVLLRDIIGRVLVVHPGESLTLEPGGEPTPATSTAPEEKVGRTPLEEMLRLAKERYDAMTPDEQEAMWAEQRRSWVRGEMGLDRKPGQTRLTREELDAAIERAEREPDQATNRARRFALHAHPSLRPGSRWKHTKRGTTYQVIDLARYNSSAANTPLGPGVPRDGDWLALYRCEQSAEYSVRSVAEFLDGRFVLLD